MPDADALRWILAVVIVLLLVAAYVIFRLVVKPAVKTGMLASIGVLLLAAWLLRGQLGSCASTCSCRILGQDIEVPACTNGAP